MFAGGIVMRSASILPVKPLDFTTGALDPRLLLTRASSATYTNAAGALATAANDTARFDYDPVSHVARGELVESQRTNEVKYSEDLTNAAWSSTTSPSTTITGPSGGYTSISFTATSTDRRFPRAQTLGFTIANGQIVTIRARFRPGPGCASIALGCAQSATRWSWAAYNIVTGVSSVYAVSSAGTASFVSVTQVSTGVWELVVQFTGGASTATGIVASFGGNGSATDIRTNSPVASCDIGFVQLEQAPFVTSYIPTTASAATRAADACSSTHADFTAWLARAAKTIAVQADSPASGTRRVFHAAKTGSEATDYISIWTSEATVKATVVAGGITQADLTLGTITAGVLFKVALSLAANDVEASLNGAAKVTDASVTLPACDKAWFGSDSTGNYLNGHLSGAWQFLNAARDVQALAA